MGPGLFLRGVERQGREADRLSPHYAELKSPWSYTSTPSYVFMACILLKHRDKFINSRVTEEYT
jgi:hypothetical protein